MPAAAAAIDAAASRRWLLLWLCAALVVCRRCGAAITPHAKTACKNPGGQKVTRGDGSQYPYFGMPCTRPAGSPDPACGDCFLDKTCTCTAAKCCAPRAGPPGYVCLPNGTDLVGEICLAKSEGPGKTLVQLAQDCDALHVAGAIGCFGFNTNGFLKRCVRSSCGAHPQLVPFQPNLVSCIRVDTPVVQKHPKGIDPTCHHGGPAPAPGGGAFTPPYGGGCAGTWNQTDCNCSGVHPPFGAPAQPVNMQKDYHFPADEPSERARLADLELISVTADNGAAVLRNLATKETTKLPMGSTKWGWELLHADASAGGSAVVEHDFDEWAELRFLWPATKVENRNSISVRKPVGRLSTIMQPTYDMEETIDPDYFCKEDIDPTDWMGRLAANISGGEEPSLEAANTLMAPNTDSGLFGNPEGHNKFMLSHRSVLQTTGDFGHAGSGRKVVWQLAGSAFLPPGCKGIADWEQVKMGMVGEHLRVINQGMWHQNATGVTGCGVEIMAVAAPPSILPDGNYSGNTTALLRVTSQAGEDTSNTSYVKIHLYRYGGSVQLDELGTDGTEFYAALLAQQKRWTDFIDRGSKAVVPQADRRYTASSNALLTMFMNTFRGLIPIYGAGQFWNLYNVYLPLDDLALNGALLAWGHTVEALEYIRFFFHLNICMDNLCIEPKVMQYGRQNGPGNATFGGIIYNVFGCDSDADYGRMLDLYVQAVQYSGNLTWAKELLPYAQALANHVMRRREEAVAEYPRGHPFHGIVYGSPEHDICSAPSYFFSPNVWFVRGLLSLGKLHAEFPMLTINKTLEAMLLPVAEAWREDIRFAANFTAVRSSKGDGSIFFLHPVVGSAYSEKNPPMSAPTPKSQLKPIEGGDEATCVARGTCFESMTAGVKGQANGGSNQHTNYANFRIFSETLLASVLDPEYERGIMDFREVHRGTLLGMTRFRDGLDDMPILGYGKGSLAHDRLYSFHNTLSGHSMNYISRGTYWGTEQRLQLDYSVGNRTGIVNHRWRNDCGVGGEDCSLCMVSGVASAYWVRWMLLFDDPDIDKIYIARGAPRRWFAQTAERFGIADAPTRFGRVTFEMQPHNDGSVRGSVRLQQVGKANVAVPLIAIKIRSAEASKPIAGNVTFEGGDKGVELVAWHAQNETAVIRLGAALAFNFTAQ